jgi:hypothetical protein
MDIQDYRRQYAAELEQAAAQRTTFRDRVAAAGPAASRHLPVEEGVAGAAGDDVELALAVLTDRELSEELRGAALREISTRIGQHPEQIDRLLQIVRDEAEPLALRHAALSVVQEISFQVAAFAGHRAAYLDTLRSIVDDPDPELRRRALGILAREKDDFAQRRLLDGLEHPSRALVPAAKAIQFLGYDVHAEHFPLMRRIIERPPSQAAKKEAIRVLAADPSARNLLAEIFTNKQEARDVRMTSAVALQSLAPDRFEREARQVVLDDDEDDALRVTSLNALTHFASTAEHSAESPFTKRVGRMRESTGAPKLRRAMDEYLAKFSS